MIYNHCEMERLVLGTFQIRNFYTMERLRYGTFIILNVYDSWNLNDLKRLSYKRSCLGTFTRWNPNGIEQV